MKKSFYPQGQSARIANGMNTLADPMWEWTSFEGNIGTFRWLLCRPRITRHWRGRNIRNGGVQDARLAGWNEANIWCWFHAIKAIGHETRQ
jgi:hypothetical protein